MTPGSSVTRAERDTGTALPDSVSRFRLAAQPLAPTVVRRSLMADLDHGLSEDLRQAVALMVTEVVANAVIHGCADASDEVAVEMHARDGTLAVAVRDPATGSGSTPVQRERAQDQEGGLGLVIVDQLASRWGFEREPAGTLVWFELAVAGGD